MKVPSTKKPKKKKNVRDRSDYPKTIKLEPMDVTDEIVNASVNAEPTTVLPATNIKIEVMTEAVTHRPKAHKRLISGEISPKQKVKRSKKE